MSQLAQLFPLLQSCRQIVSDPRVAQAVPAARLQRDLKRVDRILAGDFSR